MLGTHVDLIGAYRQYIREADDALQRKARLFEDSFDSTLAHIGELRIPLEAGVIRREYIEGDLYDLVGTPTEERAPDDIHSLRMVAALILI